MSSNVSRVNVAITGMILMTMACAMMLCIPGVAHAANDSRLAVASVSSQVITDPDTGEQNYYFGLSDGNLSSAKICVYGVKSGDLHCSEMSGYNNSYILSVSNLKADTIYIKSEYNSNCMERVSILYDGNNVIEEGIAVSGKIKSRFALYGEDNASMKLLKDGISVSGLSNKTTAADLVLSGGDVVISSAEFGIYAGYMNVLLTDGSLTLKNIPDGGVGIYATAYQMNGQWYGGSVNISNMFKMSCAMDNPVNDYAIFANWIQNNPASLTKVQGYLTQGASFVSKGKTYQLAYINDELCAKPTNGSKSPKTVKYGGVTYQNYYACTSYSGVANGKTVKIGDYAYKVLSNDKSTVALKSVPANSASVMIPATVVLNYRTYNVAGISSGAFKDSKAKTVTVKTKFLTKKSTKNCFKGAKKVKTVKVAVGGKSVNKEYVSKYKSVFVKSSCGAKVAVK